MQAEETQETSSGLPEPPPKSVTANSGCNNTGEWGIGGSALDSHLPLTPQAWLAVGHPLNYGRRRSNSITLPLKIKDEPMDEEYDCALAPQHLPEGIKDEPCFPEEFGHQHKSCKELKISAVFSVGGSQTAPPRTMTVNTSSVGSGSVVPAAPTAPPASSASVRVSCCGCKKVLLKGQTAYQRKGSSQLFCSTICLTSYNVPSIQSVLRKTCHSCWKEISNPKDVIIAPVDAAGTMKDFCSQSCLSEFDVKRKALSSAPAADGITIKCSMCQKTAAIRHEVNYQGVVHKLCSDGCFSRFRSNNKLTMNCCDNCGGYCYSGGGGGGGSQSNMLQIEGATKKFCSPACLSTYKQKSTRVSPCAMCFSLRSSAEMVESVTSQGMTELFCSTGCVTAYKVQSVRSSGKEVQCNQCKVTAVPQYHLAMSDGSMRSFCCYSCVIGFQTEFNKLATQAQMNVIPHGPSVPIVTAPQPTAPCTAAPDATAPKAPPLIVSLAPSARCPVRLTCRQCGRLFASKPELFAFKGEMIQFCGKTCAEEFKKANLIMARCEYCKIDKILKEVKMINHRECSFCSEGCKLLYKHDLTKRWGRHCQSCAYCSNTSQRVVQNHFAGKLEEFCGDSCMSHYTVLFYQMSRCDTCKRQGKLIESIQWLGDMKHFCNLQCLLQFCSQQTSVPVALAVPPSTVPTMPCPSSLASKEATPVIANVVSLSSAPVGQPSVCANTALQGTIPTTQAKVTGHASTQTDSLKLPPPTPRVLKNKALLCKPMNLNKGTICKPHTQSTHTQTEEELSRVLVLPVPIPVFIPVPLHLYTQHTQHTPVPVGVPVPVRLLHPCAHVSLQPVELKEDLLQCSPVELSYGLSLFVSGVRRPSGESYCADSLLYLCLGIQQYLCENGRSDNIFTDVLYSSFAEQITKILSDWTPAVLPGGYLHSRVQEEHLWQCKQLGTHSPAVLLNTLLLFTTKLLQLKTPGQHGRLSFAHISCGTRKLGNNSGRNVLRFCLPVQKRKDDKAVTLGKRRKEEEEGEVMEMPENTEDPLRCPVRLYKFYLSKCPDSVKQRTDMLYLQPEFPSVPDCPLWFSSQPLESSTLEAMLIRILAVREVHLDGEQAPPQATHADNEASD
uniref:Zinc finger MYM-type protein 4-like n=1 Tax=Scleropages formosus TaxID=113540 RepID=A0A8C9RDB1_SCLFO